MTVRQLPTLLVDLVESGRWHQPSDEVVRALVPCDPLAFDFLLTLDQLESDRLSYLLKHRSLAAQFRLYRSGSFVRQRLLPWVDVRKALVIAEGRVHGSDSAILLDLRTSAVDPAVLASNWQLTPGVCSWQIISPSLQAFMHEVEEVERHHVPA
jgi:hypothetical protein